MTEISSMQMKFPGSPFRGRGGQAIILAGGLGTRLRDTIPDLPKSMAPVADRPFLFYVINHLRMQGIDQFIFSLGYRHEVITEYLETQFATLNYQCAIEEEPLDTGGAIKHACEETTRENILVTNGDTLFKFDINELESIHHENTADATLALKPMKNFDRYGMVEMNKDGLIIGFREKQFCENGMINAGTYLLNRKTFLAQDWPVKFSFEKEFLESKRFRLFGSVQDAYFIDIGIPEDYKKAQTELVKPLLDLSAVNKNWTLFIDRDGVINHEKADGYILNRDEFQFEDGVKEAFRLLSAQFGKIIIVSNQRGVGKGLMTETDLSSIHQYMQEQIEAAGGRIDKIYYCASTDDKDPERKPNPGMALRAKTDIPSIDLSRSIIVGNKLSDMLFGRNAGIYTVFAATTIPQVPFPHPDIDLRFGSLPDFAKALKPSQNFTPPAAL